MLFTAEQIANILESNQVIRPSDMIRYIGFDSRNLSFPEETIFFALKGRLDGHEYIQQAYNLGVRNFVISEAKSEYTFGEANLFLVQNPLEALQKLAVFHRKQFQLPVIGITGSNGKTIVKDWLSQLLENEYFIVKSPRSYNSQLGVPLSVLNIEKNHDLGIFEAGISKPNEMKNLENMIQPKIGILTNIGDAHDDGFLNREEKINEKLCLFENAEVVICNASYLPFLNARFKHKQFFTWKKIEKNSEPDANLNIISIKENSYQSVNITAIFEHKEIEITIPFSDYPSIENAITCWITMFYLGYSQSVIAERIAKLQAVALRMEIKAGVNNCVIINDAYSFDLTSLEYSLDFLNQQAKGKKTLILSDLEQNQKQFSIVAKLLESKKVERLILIGENSNQLRTSIPTTHYFSTEEFLKTAKFSDFENETILLKGARSFEFEKIATFLGQKAHRTVLEINLDALRHNLGVYSKLLQPKVKMLVMVKASAYGSGSSEVAKLLEYQRVDYLGVAYSDEGVTLRKEGIKLPILVLNPEEAAFPAMLRYDLEPELYCFSQMERFLSFVKNEKKRVGVHLKLDTGMHRLGFEMPDIQRLVEILQQNNQVEVKSVFSHLAGSEADEHDDFTAKQAALFTAMYEKIVEGIGYRPIRHICNTGGIARFPQYHFDMVRLGIGIYGVDSNGIVQPQLQVVNTLKATISQIKNISEGETIGYSRKGLATKDLRIATIGIGYADGFLRNAGNGRYAVGLHGALAPVIGNVCMDMTMIDISEIPEAQEGDEVIVFGEFPRVETLAKATQTIAYEVFTNISERVKRVYFRT